MNHYTLLEEVKQYVITYFNAHDNDIIIYHNRAHTESVVTAAVEIANHYQLSDQDYFIVITAAWFHDMGYYTDPAHHEDWGAQEASTFLQRKNVAEDIIQKVVRCIQATRMPQAPETLLENIVADADLFHLGTPQFGERNKLMRKEYIAMHQVAVSKEEWRNKTIRLLQSHQYHTDYCRLLLSEQKSANLQKLLAKSALRLEVAKPVPAVQPISLAETNKQKAQTAAEEEKLRKKNRPDRGIETMFRITSANHQRLSDMADSKAHIMISVNSIIISVLLSVLLKNLDQYPQFIIPAMLLLGISLVTIVFAILATRPNIPSGIFTQNDIAEKKVNLLFFGNFYKMSLDDYTHGMLQMMDDREFLYKSLIKDVYSQGVVLGTKYRRLRTSYNVFMFGLIASVIAFAIAVVIFG